MKIYSNVSGKERETLEKTYDVFGVLAIAAIPLAVVAIALGPGGLGGMMHLIASTAVLLSGGIALFNVGGVGTEIGAAMVFAREQRTSTAEASRYQSLGRLAG